MKKFNNVSKTLVISFYNESKNVKQLILEIENFKKSYKIDEVIFINNSSTDNTGNILKNQCLNQKYKYINKLNSKGYGDGYFEAIKNSSSDFILTNHSDLQFSFSDLKTFLDKDNPDFFDNTAFFPIRHNRSIFAYLKTYILRVIYTFIHFIKVNDHNGHPKIFPKKIFDKITNNPKTGAFDFFIYYLLKKKNINISYYKVYERKRRYGVSSFSNSFLKELSTFFEMIKEVLNFNKFIN